MTTTTISSNTSPTLEQIASAVKQLQPLLAAQRFSSPRAKELCCTPVYTSAALSDGSVVQLKKVDGKHAAGYIRVSTARQRSRTGVDQGDGFSEDDQIERIVSFFVRKQLAFQVYSDCGLSGSLPTRDPKLMEKLWRRKARTYKAVFDAVFLDDRKYTAEEIAQMRGYMDAEVKRIERGGALAGVDDDVEATTLPLPYPHPSPALAQQPHGAGAGDNSNGNASEAIVSDVALLPQHKNKPRGASAAKFRPALTFFVDDLPKIHTLALTDMSRFARSDALFAELTDQLEQHEVHIEGVIESLGWMNDQELSGVLTAKVLSVVSEFKIREVVLGSLRGILARLESGRPHGTLPFWLSRDDDGFAVENGNTEVVRGMVQQFLAEQGTGSGTFRSVARWLAAQKIKPPKGGDWSPNTITNILRNPALIGYQQAFGKRWQVIPAIIEEETWQALRDKDDARSKDAPKATERNPEGYLMTGLIRCRCGRYLAWHKRGDETPQYVCRAPSSARGEGMSHVTLNAADVDSFFNSLMAGTAAVFLRAFGSEEELVDAREQIKQLEDELATLRQARLSEAAAVRQRAIQKVKDAYGLEESDREFDEMVASSERVLQRDSLRREEECQVQLKEKRQRLAATIRGDERAALEKQALRWREMNNREKNRMLRKVFDTFNILGEPPKERLSVHVHAEYDMHRVGGLFPSITIQNKPYGKAIRRKLMSVAEYMAVLDSWGMMLAGPAVSKVD